MVQLSGPPRHAIRNRPITGQLIEILEAAAEAAGVDHVRITSGGQPGTHGRRTGSTRHDDGRAADLQLVIGGVTQSFSDNHGGPVFEGFVEAAAARGATGIGAGVGYMGRKTIHVGFGLTPSDHRRLTWGARGRSANAPRWLRQAAEAGWAAPQPLDASPIRHDSVELPARFVVNARSGLNVRNGPGLEYSISNVLTSGTELIVIELDGPDSDWARVDLEDDGLIDGHVFAAFLAASSEGDAAIEDADEPNDYDAD